MSQPRVPRGVPTGGQFASANYRESNLELGEDVDQEIVERSAVLAAHGYLPPVAFDANIDPSSTAHKTEWWDRAFATAEYSHSLGDYPQMPDDYTPSHTLGRALSGHRRTHRMAYSGAGVELRMPSVTSIRGFAMETRGTFDVPVVATYPGGSVSGWVRVTRLSDGSWASRGLGFSPEASSYVAESVQCLLEARRPSRALAEVGDLLDRRRQRAAKLGIRPQPVRSSWVRSVGYDPASSTMVMSTSSSASYGYAVPPSVFQSMLTSEAPGRVFNARIKGRATQVRVVQCASCSRFHREDAEHRCPPKEAPRLGRSESNAMHAGRVLSRFGRRSSESGS